MKILITGAGGFLGNRLARELMARGRLRARTGTSDSIAQLVLADLAFSPAARADLAGPVTFVEGDLSADATIGRVMEPGFDVIFHFAAMVSGEGERDFDGCLRVNLDGTRHLLEHARRLGSRPRVVFASSVAVFGGAGTPPVVSDQTRTVPQTTYGMTKRIGELLINDYTRKGFIEGRAPRFPTIFIRPGKPNAAASSFASAMFREPLAGQPCVIPVPPEQGVPLLGYRTLMSHLIALAECDQSVLGDDCSVTLPSTLYRVGEAIEVLRTVARDRGLPLGPISFAPDPVILRIIQGWPIGTDATRVAALGLQPDPSLAYVIEHYIRDFMPAGGRA